MTRAMHITGLLVLGTLAGIVHPAHAAACSATVEANDAMQFNTKSIDVPKSCKQFTVTLKHAGQLPATAMGHNFVVARTADLDGVAADGMKAGAASNYVKAGDARVVAASKIVGGGQSATVNIAVAKLKPGQPYSFFCTFPGHSSIMRGTFAVK